MREEQRIYRGEVMAIMGALADIRVKADRTLAFLEGNDDEEEEEEEAEPPDA